MWILALGGTGIAPGGGEGRRFTLRRGKFAHMCWKGAGGSSIMRYCAVPAVPWRVRLAVWAGAGIGAAAAATGLMWAHYGSAVFYEMIIAGLASCL